MYKSRILKEDHDAIIALHRRMKPEERLVAFYHHNLLISQMYRAGACYRETHQLESDKGSNTQ